MARQLSLVKSDDLVPPCGVIAAARYVPWLAERAAGLAGFRLAGDAARFILYHPTAEGPDLPWLGDDVTYLGRVGQGLYAPSGLHLNVPPRLMSEMIAKLRHQYRLSGDILVTDGAPLVISDMAQAHPITSVDFGKLIMLTGQAGAAS